MACKTKQYGYDDCRFEKDVDEHFHCSICFNVLKDARMCKNNEHMFCAACIFQHLIENSRTCPECNEYLTVDTLRRPRVLNNYLSKLKINCDYASRGCTEFICVEDLESHVATCGFAPVLCSNQNCGLVIDKQEKVHHETVACEYRKCHDCAKIQEDVTALKGSLLKLHEKLRAVKDEMKNNNDQIKQEQEEIKRDVLEVVEEMKTVKESLCNVNEGMDEMKVTMCCMLEKLNMLDLPSKPPCPTEEVLCAPKEDILIAGGDDSAEIFCWDTNTWYQIESMNEAHYAASSFTNDDKLFVVGGLDTKTIETLDGNALPLKWVKFPVKFPYESVGHKNVVYQHRVLHIGGYNYDERETSNVISVMQLAIPPYTMQQLCQMPKARDCHGVEAFENKILVMGGVDKNGDILDSVLKFDPEKNECTEMPPLPYFLKGMATVRWRDQVVVLGGRNEDKKVVNDVFMYDSNTGKTTTLPSMLKERYNSCAVITGNTVVVMGGENDNFYLCSVEYFTMGDSTWNYLPDLHRNRYRAIAELLSSTKKYI